LQLSFYGLGNFAFVKYGGDISSKVGENGILRPQNPHFENFGGVGGGSFFRCSILSRSLSTFVAKVFNHKL